MVGMVQVMLAMGSTPPSTDVDVHGTEVTAVGASSGATQALYGLTSGGLEQSKAGAGPLTTINTWLLSGAASLYDVRATTVATIGSGSLTGSGTGTWLNLATSRSWSFGNGTIGTTGKCDLLIEVRLSSSGAVLDSATVTLNTERV